MDVSHMLLFAGWEITIWEIEKVFTQHNQTYAYFTAA